MRWCVYDNPSNLRREWWVDGFCMQWVDMSLLYSAGVKVLSSSPCYPDLARPFESGRVEGDAWALVDRLAQAWM